MSNHPIDTVIYIRTEEFQRYCRILHSIEFQEGNIDNIHDYYIGIKCDGVNLAIQLPIPDSLNEEIITTRSKDITGQSKIGIYMNYFARQDISISFQRKS